MQSKEDEFLQGLEGEVTEFASEVNTREVFKVVLLYKIQVNFHDGLCKMYQYLFVLKNKCKMSES